MPLSLVCIRDVRMTPLIGYATFCDVMLAFYVYVFCWQSKFKYNHIFKTLQQQMSLFLKKMYFKNAI